MIFQPVVVWNLTNKRNPREDTEMEHIPFMCSRVSGGAHLHERDAEGVTTAPQQSFTVRERLVIHSDAIYLE